jgi:hypothetical protein
MKRIAVLLLGIFAANLSASSSGEGPRVLCREVDNGPKSVRIAPGPWGGRMQATIYHNGTAHQILKCDYNTDVLYRCSDENDVARVFTLQHDLTGLYEGTQEVREMKCRIINR